MNMEEIEMGAFRESLLRDLRVRSVEQAAVWLKGTAVPGYDPAVWRKDVFGSWMKRESYGNCSSTYGWEIDHILPTERGGSENLSNKQPLQWENNRRKGDKMPSMLRGII
jgi:5-methylcytosine-specific restriction endonuclease McrA